MFVIIFNKFQEVGVSIRFGKSVKLANNKK